MRISKNPENKTIDKCNELTVAVYDSCYKTTGKKIKKGYRDNRYQMREYRILSSMPESIENCRYVQCPCKIFHRNVKEQTTKNEIGGKECDL